MKRLLLTVLKLGVSAAILAYLAFSARDSLPDLRGQQKHWGLLLAAAVFCFTMVVVTIVRWYLLVRALHLPFRLRDAFRLGFLGYMLNFFSLGATGGDLFKAIFLAREQPGKRVEAVASVVVDRVIGLYALLLLASAAVLATGLWNEATSAVVRLTCRATLLATAVFTLGGFLLITPGFTSGKLTGWLSRLPKIGSGVERLIAAVRLYRQHLPLVVWTIVMSVVGHALNTICVYLAACGLPGAAPTFGAHFLIWPLGGLASALPLPLSGLGAMEAVLDFLYVHVPGPVPVAKGSGLIVALTYRVITIGVAIVGFCYYLTNRAKVAAIMKSAQDEHQPQPAGDKEKRQELELTL